MKRLLFVAFACLLSSQLPLGAASPVVISEFMALNVTNGFPANIGIGLRDDFGEYSDWIEIRNVTTTNVSLLNWALTDLMLEHREIALMGEDIGPKGGVYGVTLKLPTAWPAPPASAARPG